MESAGPETLVQLGQTIQVAGKIAWYQRDPVLPVNSPDQIEVLP